MKIKTTSEYYFLTSEVAFVIPLFSFLAYVE